MQLFLDTDIGTDVDDALALALILGSPELSLVGISTVYGDTLLRARLASRLLALSDAVVPVAAGERETRSGRPVWWPGHEGALHSDLETEPVDPDVDGVQLLVDTAARLSGELVVLAIGPLTNIAAALDRSVTFERDVARIVIMGGDFTDENRRAEHNILSDIAAAQRVFSSSLHIVVGGLDLTTRVQLTEDDVNIIAGSGTLGRALEAEIAAWWKFHGTRWNNPHDPILALWLMQPELFTERRAAVTVTEDGLTIEAPMTRETIHHNTVVVLGDKDADQVRLALVRRIAAADAVTIEG